MSPQPQPIRNCHVSLSTKLPTLPDLVLTALSVCSLFSSSAKPKKRSLSSSSLPFFPRREVKFSTMPLLHSHSFANPKSLSDWLGPRLPSESFASWGVKPGTKNVHNLWLEISEGETSLADSVPPVRTVHVVTVRILSADRTRILIEARQELSDGTVRSRDRPLSEKMKPNEDIESAVNRAVAEELGTVAGEVKIVPGSYAKKVEERNSSSYPGLPARYELHSVEAVVEGLPDGEFSTAEEDEYGGAEISMVSAAERAVSVKKHFWRWVSIDSVQN